MGTSAPPVIIARTMRIRSFYQLFNIFRVSVQGVLDEAQAANKQMSSQLNRLNEVIAQETTNFKRKYRRLEHDNELLSSENEKLKDQLMSTSQRVASVDDDMVQMKARHAKTEALCSELLEEKQLTEVKSRMTKNTKKTRDVSI